MLNYKLFLLVDDNYLVSCREGFEGKSIGDFILVFLGYFISSLLNF